MIEETFVMIKPDGVKRGLIGEIISRLERKMMKIEELRMLTLTKEMAEKLYEVHKGKDFFKELVDYVTSGPVVVMKIEGGNAILNCRIVVGDTSPERRVPGSIRGDFSPFLMENLVHASSSKEDAERELKLFFG